jgi:hypothetical protein
VRDAASVRRKQRQVGQWRRPRSLSLRPTPNIEQSASKEGSVDFQADGAVGYFSFQVWIAIRVGSACFVCVMRT